VPISGPSALISLSMAAGLPTDRLTFLGFLPHKKEARNTEIKSWNQQLGSVVFYDTATRIEDTLKIIALVWPDASIAIGRELTKTYEEIVKFPIAKSLDWFELKKKSHTLKGEFVLMCSGFSSSSTEQEIYARARKQATELFEQGLHQKKIMKELAHLGIERSKLYNLLLEVKREVAQSKV
jgi:16S rRNA (cytidine1402-2'-O)-methyltransferase